MLRIRGDRNSLLAALVSHWLDQTLQLSPSTKATEPAKGQPQRPKTH